MRTPREATLSKARAAGMAKATAGRARAFEMQRPQPDATEIAEGLEDWEAAKQRSEPSPNDELPEDYADWDF